MADKKQSEEQQSAWLKMNRTYRKVFLSTKEGREVLQEILDFSGVLTQSFTGNSETFFKLGKQEVGLMILNALDKNHMNALRQLEQAGGGLTGYHIDDPFEDFREDSDSQ